MYLQRPEAKTLIDIVLPHRKARKKAATPGDGYAGSVPPAVADLAQLAKTQLTPPRVLRLQ
jgi:hypothetical protein